MNLCGRTALEAKVAVSRYQSICIENARTSELNLAQFGVQIRGWRLI
jgi:hypothetical protein